jgi:hypothetical protein
MMGIGIGVQFGSKLDPAIAIINDGNTVAWYDSQDLTTITKDGSNLVSLWKDKLLSGHDLIAATTARPTWSTIGILFNGTANYMKTAAFIFSQPEFIYLVFKQITWTNGERIIDGDSVNTMDIEQGTITPRLSGYAGTSFGNTDNTRLTLDTFGIIRVLFNGLNSKIIINNGTVVTGNSGASNAGGITIGIDGGIVSSLYAHIEIKEAIFRNVSDSSGDEALIYAYLKNKYSL